MLSSLFQSSSLPVLEQVVNFTEARHGVLAGNIANLDTPGYKTRDLSPALFQQRLQGSDRNEDTNHFADLAGRRGRLCRQPTTSSSNRQAGRSPRSTK